MMQQYSENHVIVYQVQIEIVHVESNLYFPL